MMRRVAVCQALAAAAQWVSEKARVSVSSRWCPSSLRMPLGRPLESCSENSGAQTSDPVSNNFVGNDLRHELAPPRVPADSLLQHKGDGRFCVISEATGQVQGSKRAPAGGGPFVWRKSRIDSFLTQEFTVVAYKHGDAVYKIDTVLTA